MTAATMAATVVTLSGSNRPDSKAANHERNPNSRRNPGYPGAQFYFGFE
jgi:hypothetical protein